MAPSPCRVQRQHHVVSEPYPWPRADPPQRTKCQHFPVATQPSRGPHTVRLGGGGVSAVRWRGGALMRCRLVCCRISAIVCCDKHWSMCVLGSACGADRVMGAPHTGHVNVDGACVAPMPPSLGGCAPALEEALRFGGSPTVAAHSMPAGAHLSSAAAVFTPSSAPHVARCPHCDSLGNAGASPTVGLRVGACGATRKRSSAPAVRLRDRSAETRTPMSRSRSLPTAPPTAPPTASAISLSSSASAASLSAAAEDTASGRLTARLSTSKVTVFNFSVTVFPSSSSRSRSLATFSQICLHLSLSASGSLISRKVRSRLTDFRPMPLPNPKLPSMLVPPIPSDAAGRDDGMSARPVDAVLQPTPSRCPTPSARTSRG
eukprot:m.1534698 g.1534698  ORF g.1534698 m.1534698 type:complete len:375 (-) comp25243_c0_seq52:4173-5297(-)